MSRLVSVLIGILLVLVSLHSLSQGVKILEYVSKPVEGSGSADRRLNILEAQRHVLIAKVAKVNFPNFESDWLSMVLPDGKEIQIFKKQGSGFFTDSKNFGWVGEIRIGGGSALFSMHQGVLAGTIKLPTGYYSIEPLGDNLYSISKQSSGGVPPADPETGPLKEPRSESRSLPLVAPSASAMVAGQPTVIRVLLAYTLVAGNRVNGSVASRAILQLNEAFKMSGVNAQAEIAGLLPLNMGESGLFSHDLETTRLLPELAKHRDDVSADIVITFVGKIAQSEELCGLAFLNPSAEYAYGIVSAEYLGRDGDCFAHEVGHILGADHHLAKASAASFRTAMVFSTLLRGV